MLNLDWATIAFQVANFLILAVLLYYLLFRPVMRRAKARAAEKERLALEAAQEQEEAAALRAEWEARLENAEKEAADIVSRAQEQADREREEILQEAQAEAERILVGVHADAQRLRQQAVDEFHDQLLDAIVEISGSLIGRVTPQETHDALIQQLSDRIWDLGRSEIERVETYRRSLGERTPVAYVTTAHPLSSEHQGLLARTFSALADRHVNLEVRTVPALGAGMRVRLGDIVVDNSIAGRLEELRDKASRALEERIVAGAANE